MTQAKAHTVFPQPQRRQYPHTPFWPLKPTQSPSQSLHTSPTLSIPSSPVMSRHQSSEAGMSKAHVRRRKGLLCWPTRWSCHREYCQRRHPSIKGIFVSPPPPLCLSSVALLNYTACALLLLLSGGLTWLLLLACAEPSFDTVPCRLCCVVLMCCWRLVCGGQWAEFKTGIMCALCDENRK